MKAEESSDVEPLMTALDNLAKRFLARKKLYHIEREDGNQPIIHWLFSDTVMQQLGASATADNDVEAVRRLISARYLVAEDSGRPWEFVWDE